MRKMHEQIGLDLNANWYCSADQNAQAPPAGWKGLPNKYGETLLAHDLEHASAASGAYALHRFTAVGHGHFGGTLHVALCFALYAIGFNGSCHLFRGI